VKPVSTPQAPAAVGPYSQAIVVDRFVYTAGQVGLDPRTGKLVLGGLEPETRQALANLAAILEAAGGGLDRVVKTTVFLADMRDFPVMNAIYAEAFREHRPARSTVQAAALPLGARVEIEAVGYLAVAS
jgi:2-iminobutanoate/2-iminopropanoate deaminase